MSFFLGLGVAARNLLGSGVKPILPKHRFDNSMLKLLQSAGWHFMDFKLLGILDHFKKNNPDFVNIFTDDFSAKSVQFGALNLKYVFGDKECCGVCKDSYQSDEQVLFLECQHIFHYDCIAEFLRDKKNCPYCRSHTKFKPE